jgi:RNA polymerase sigma-70 factor, ECF subfamily
MTPDPSFRTAMLATVPKLRAFAISLCRNRDQADDLVQETLLRAWENMASFTPGTSITAWMYTILRNYFFSECRRRRKPMDSIDDHVERIASRPTQVACAESQEVCEALEKLGSKQREALMLIGASGVSYEEAAKICGCPTGTVKSRVNRARAELARLLSIHGPEHFEEDHIVAAVIARGGREALTA